MLCTDCQRRSALIAALAPAISRLSFTREGLFGLLSLPEAQLLYAAKVGDADEFLRRLEIPPRTDSLPTVICCHDADYPKALAQLGCAPTVLHATWTIERLRALLSQPTVAIVGGRLHTDYAQQMTLAFAHNLAAAGVTVISGVDNGLEGSAQHGALNAGGQTIAVMPCGPEIPTSNEHEDLHRRILARGAAVSEFPPGFFPPQRWCFIASQRIIAALASVIVVVEAGGRSCALFTARISAELGHDVAVVPGRLTDPGGLGTFGLLQDGAHPVACAEDVLDLIGGAGMRGVCGGERRRRDSDQCSCTATMFDVPMRNGKSASYRESTRNS